MQFKTYTKKSKKTNGVSFPVAKKTVNKKKKVIESYNNIDFLKKEIIKLPEPEKKIEMIQYIPWPKWEDWKDGKDGKDGIDGIDGNDWKDGIDGNDGKDGIDGKDGKDGKDGIDGNDGKDGIDGKDWKDGKDGIDWKDWKDGEKWDPGEDGKDGTSITIKWKVKEKKNLPTKWQQGNIYFVEKDGHLYWWNNQRVDMGKIRGEDGYVIYGWGGTEWWGLKEPLQKLQFDINAINDIHNEWQINRNADDKTLEIHTDVAGVRIQLWQENVLRVVNKTWSTLLNWSVVYVNWAQWNRPTVALADADIATTAEAVIGVVTADITDNHNWYVTTFWLVRGLDTSAYTAWQTLYLSSTAWALTATVPTVNKVKVCHVIVVHWTQGIILVDINVYENKDKLLWLQSQNFYVDTIVNNQITEWHWEDTTTIVNTYNGSNKLTTAVYTFPDATTTTLTITYDVNGNISTALYS